MGGSSSSKWTSTTAPMTCRKRGEAERGGVRWGMVRDGGVCVLWIKWPVEGVWMYCDAMYAMHDWVGMMR